MIELRRTFLIACGLTLLILLAACDLETPAAGPSPSPSAATAVAAITPTAIATSTPTTGPTATPTPGVPQGGAVTIRLDADVPDLKPWDLRSRNEEIIADLMYNGLVELDPQLAPQPDLSESWDVSDDGRLITFTLRDDLRWHDGQPLIADDVQWTLNILRTITPTNSLLFDLRSVVAQVEAPLSDTVVISLTQPHAPILSGLAVPILPRHRLQELSPDQIGTLNFWQQPIGSGPFKYDQRRAGESISFTRNEAYFNGAPNLDQIALVVAPDPTVAQEALASEQLLVAELPGVTDTIITTEGLATGAYPENGWYGVVFNTRPDRLFADARLREALARAVDVPLLVDQIVGDAGTPITSIIPRTAWTYPEGSGITPPAVAEAQRLLDEAGWTIGSDGVRQKDGRPLAAQLWVRGDDPVRVAAAQRIAESAQAIGMRLDVLPANFDTVILAKLAPPYDFDLLLGSWVNAPNSAGFPTNRFYDPDDFALFHSSRIWQGEGDPRTALRNVGGFSNPAYDAAAEQARRAYDLAERAQAIEAAQAVLARERPYLLLWTNTIPVLINERVQSADGPIEINSPRYLWHLERWYLEP